MNFNSLSENILHFPASAKNSDSNEAVGPSLGLRKSSSLESLQTMIQELNKDDEAMKRAYQSGASRSSRSRGCNESFRAAVDRSYDVPSSATMETCKFLNYKRTFMF